MPDPQRSSPDLTYLLQGLVIYEACGILWDVELPLLDMLAELPTALSALLLGRTSQVTSR